MLIIGNVIKPINPTKMWEEEDEMWEVLMWEEEDEMFWLFAGKLVGWSFVRSKRLAIFV